MGTHDNPTKQSPSASETDKAWMAGFVDGEGCLTISRQIRKGRPSPAYRASITVTNTCRAVQLLNSKGQRARKALANA